MYNTEITQASNFVKGVDSAFIVIMGISFVFLLGLTATMIYFIYKYNRKRHPKAVQMEGSTRLEIIWTIIPLALTMVMFYYGWAGWKPMGKAPKDAMEITVVGRMWNFIFEYENGRKTDTLYVPKDKAIKLNLKSMDVIHSVYIPAFRVKQDMVPGKKDNFMWFIPQREGTYELYCTEYCGLNHSYMFNYVKVVEDSIFNTWYSDTTMAVASADVESPVAAGRRIMQNIGCFACHSVDGGKLVGPTFKGLYGHAVNVTTNGQKREVIADDEYIRRAIFDPNADLVDGFGRGLMLSYKDQLSDDDVTLIIEYLKTLQ